ncbi:unnamed protein product [Moneuplotes crassus]|uniref:BZIP domain-containing protein n=2 Tax=Euplotes crassus TaxID=5936 RepID=A0AAD1UC80_EUPCR|nr:unnamed protein product [Moneuplotes crassus]
MEDNESMSSCTFKYLQNIRNYSNELNLNNVASLSKNFGQYEEGKDGNLGMMKPNRLPSFGKGLPDMSLMALKSEDPLPIPNVSKADNLYNWIGMDMDKGAPITQPMASKTSIQKQALEEQRKRDEKTKAKERRKKDLNNARARKSRLKKKKFYEELEGKYNELQEELERKDKLIEDLKAALFAKESTTAVPVGEANQKYKVDLLEDCDHLLQNLSKNKEFCAKEREIAELYQPFGTERVKTINSAFNTIVENIHPEEFKILFKYCDTNLNKRVKRSEKDQGESSEYKTYASKILKNINNTTMKHLKGLKDQVKSTIAEVLKFRTEVLKTMIGIQAFQDDNMNFISPTTNSKKGSLPQSLSETHKLSQTISMNELWSIHKRTLSVDQNGEEVIRDSSRSRRKSVPQKEFQINHLFLEY